MNEMQTTLCDTIEIDWSSIIEYIDSLIEQKMEKIEKIMKEIDGSRKEMEKIEKGYQTIDNVKKERIEIKNQTKGMLQRLKEVKREEDKARKTIDQFKWDFLQDEIELEKQRSDQMKQQLEQNQNELNNEKRKYNQEKQKQDQEIYQLRKQIDEFKQLFSNDVSGRIDEMKRKQIEKQKKYEYWNRYGKDELIEDDENNNDETEKKQQPEKRLDKDIIYKKETSINSEKDTKYQKRISIENEPSSDDTSTEISHKSMIKEQTINMINEKCNLTNEEQKQIEQWTLLKIGDTVFDSEIDDWSTKTSTFEKKIEGRGKLVFVIEDTSGNKFGYYMNTTIQQKYNEWTPTDQKSFLFSLKSNGRLNGMMKFEIKNTRKGFYLHKQSAPRLCGLGGGFGIGLMKKGSDEGCWCTDGDDNFNFHGVKNALCGSSWPDRFFPKRTIIIQMK